MSERRTDVPAAAGGTASFEPWPSGVDLHVEWEAAGAMLAAVRGDRVVIVDVLSFSTAVTRAVSLGATALSYSEAEIEEHGGRERLCAEVGATIVSKDRAATDGGYSLSPASLGGIGPGERLIFTSLNGARCTAGAQAAPAVAVGALTNRRAVAAWLTAGRGAGGGRATLIASGERWSSTEAARGWRPGLEDHLGIGAIASAAAAQGARLSVEASAAASVYDAVAADGAAIGGLAVALEASISGRELITRGYAEDVTLAAAVDSVDVVPVWDTENPVREFAAWRA